MTRRLFGMLVAAAVIGATFMAGVASADPEPVTFYACLTDKGELTNVEIGEPTGTCKDGKETRISWNSEGPPGRDGEDGTDGAPGPQGETGESGESCSVAEEPAGSFTMTCPDGSSVSWKGEPAEEPDAPAPDIVVTLSWVGPADLDLHVIEPDSEHLYFGDKTTDTGGRLEDDVPTCLSSPTALHVESAIWSNGSAESGQYQTYVDAFALCGGGVPEWTLTVRLAGEIVAQYEGEVDMASGSSIFVPTEAPYTFDF